MGREKAVYKSIVPVLVILFLTCFFTSALAQNKSKRNSDFITDEASGSSYYDFGEKGALKANRSKSFEDKQRLWKFQYFNKNGDLLKEYSLVLNRKFYSFRSSANQSAVFVLFKETPTEYLVIQFTADGYNKYDIEFFDPIQIRNFNMVGDKALIGGNLGLKDNFYKGSRGTRPMFFQYDFGSKRFTPFEALYSSKKESIQNRVELDKGLVTVLSKAEGVYNLKNFNLDGKLVSNQDLIEGVQDKVLRSAKVFPLVKGYQYVVGTYSDNETQLYTGMYVLKYGQNGIVDSVFTPYFQIEGFYDHMSKQKEERLRLKAQRKWNEKGTWSTSMELLVREPVIDQIQAIFPAPCFNGPYKRNYKMKLDFENLEFSIY